MAFSNYWRGDRDSSGDEQLRRSRERGSQGADRNPPDLGFQRRGRREGSDYYGDDPERYGAGNYDTFSREYDFGAERDQSRFRGRGPKGYRRSDERIREDACECLTHDEQIDASAITVDVKDGEVTLTGSVSSRRAKRHAEDLVEGVRGVEDVHNQLRIVSESVPEAYAKQAGSTSPSGDASLTDQSRRGSHH